MTYCKVQPSIQQWVESDPKKNFPNLIRFVVLTIQQPFHSMMRQIDSVNREGIDSKYVWGNKKLTFNWLLENPGTVHDMYQEIRQSYHEHSKGEDSFSVRNIHNLTDKAALATLTEIPGLGLAKGGFVAQLAFSRVGCLDRHNLSTIYPLKYSNRSTLKDPIRVNLDKYYINNKSNTNRNPLRNIDTYLSYCHSIGSEDLWNNWCSFIDAKYPKHFGHSNPSSEYHLSCLERFA